MYVGHSPLRRFPCCHRRCASPISCFRDLGEMLASLSLSVQTRKAIMDGRGGWISLLSSFTLSPKYGGTCTVLSSKFLEQKRTSKVQKPRSGNQIRSAHSVPPLSQSYFLHPLCLKCCLFSTAVHPHPHELHPDVSHDQFQSDDELNSQRVEISTKFFRT
jgi:hypothetical protein